ncbi:MAG: hypothetical protein MZV63_12795 [Marinilabiliales bacterium]|nr:hypothetical protein [Marinilabiliales bacterium]
MDLDLIEALRDLSLHGQHRGDHCQRTDTVNLRFVQSLPVPRGGTGRKPRPWY